MNKYMKFYGNQQYFNDTILHDSSYTNIKCETTYKCNHLSCYRAHECVLRIHILNHKLYKNMIVMIFSINRQIDKKLNCHTH